MSPLAHAANGTNDLFISYSHIDNRPWGAGQYHWITELHQWLQARLAMFLGREVRIWRDDKLAGNDEFDERIAAEIKKSALFLCVLSPRYLKSASCLREIDLFLERDRSSPSDAGAPLFKVVKTPIELNEQPDALRRFLGYDFFRELPSGKTHEFYPSRDETSEESRGFWQRVDDLAQEMKAPLARDQVPTATTGRSASSGKTIYLAETTADVKLARDGIRRELGQRGYRIVPDQSLPMRAEELLPFVEAAVGGACLTVHPVGGRYGAIPEGDTRSIVELQLDAALTRNGHSQHVIWIAPEALPALEPRQEEFLHKLRRVYTEQQGTELLEQKPLEALKTRLVEKLGAPRPPSRSSQNVRVYLICEPPDLDAVRPLESFLRAEGFTVHLPLLEGEEAEIRQDHQETLVLCDAVLIYYGAGRPAWLRAKQRDLWKASGWGRTTPFRSQAVYVAPSAASDNLQHGDAEFLVLREEGAVAQALGPFIDQLRSAARGSS